MKSILFPSHDRYLGFKRILHDELSQMWVGQVGSEPVKFDWIIGRTHRPIEKLVKSMDFTMLQFCCFYDDGIVVGCEPEALLHLQAKALVPTGYGWSTKIRAAMRSDKYTSKGYKYYTGGYLKLIEKGQDLNDSMDTQELFKQRR